MFTLDTNSSFEDSVLTTRYLEAVAQMCPVKKELLRNFVKITGLQSDTL